jgi:hypothetical protein
VRTRGGGRTAAPSASRRRALTAAAGRTVVAVLPVFVVVSCVGGVDGAGPRGEDRPPASPGETSAGVPGERRSGIATVVDGEPDVPYVVGRRLHNAPVGSAVQRLAGRVHAPFAGTLSPAAVLDPSSTKMLAYNSWRNARPVVRVRDLDSGDESLVDQGAFSIAWSEDGALAYFKGLRRRVRNPETYRGDVVVRAPGAKRPVRWTKKPGRYVVAAWARGRLVVHRRRGLFTDVVVFSGPRRSRIVAKGAALVALSPDGSRAFVADRADPAPVVRVIELRGGSEVARLSLANERDPTTDRPPSYVAYSGSWTRDVVVAAVGGGIGVFRIEERSIELDQLLGLNPDFFPVGVDEPQGDASGRYVVASVELAPAPGAAVGRRALIECDLVLLACELGSEAPYVQPPRLVYNPSRP